METSVTATASATHFSKARLWRCLAAMCYDGLLLIALNILVAFAIVNLSTPQDAMIHKQLLVLPTWVRHGLLFPAMILTTGLFYSYFWVSNRQTLGMQTWHIRIERIDGEPLRWRTAWLRYLYAFAGFTLAGVGYWWSFIDHQGLCLHDRLSQTYMVHVPRKRKSAQKA